MARRKGVFFPRSDAANERRQQSRAGTMGSSSTDTVAPSSLSEQKMEVKKKSEASETSHLKKNKTKKNPQNFNLSFFPHCSWGEHHHCF